MQIHYFSMFCTSSSLCIDLVVPCQPVTDPKNGVITCSLGDDGVLSYKDTCSYTCKTGYKLTGHDTRTCMSDGRWSGTKPTCSKGWKSCCLCIL